MQFKFWAVREGKEDDAVNAIEDLALQKIGDYVRPIWSENHTTHESFVEQAIVLLQTGFATVIPHPALTWYGTEHVPGCTFDPVCYQHSSITILDGGDTPIKAQIDSMVLLADQ